MKWGLYPPVGKTNPFFPFVSSLPVSFHFPFHTFFSGYGWICGVLKLPSRVQAEPSRRTHFGAFYFQVDACGKVSVTSDSGGISLHDQHKRAILYVCISSLYLVHATSKEMSPPAGGSNCWQMGRGDEKSSSFFSGDYSRSTIAENDTLYTSSYSCLMVFIAVTVFTRFWC